MERQLTFIDVDENRLELWLKPDRVQLVVVDSRPELEAAELRRFASVVFAEYVARDLADRLATARGRLQEVRDRACGLDLAPGLAPGLAPALAPGGELAAALDSALRAIDELAAAVAIPEPVAPEIDAEAPALDPEPEEPWEPEEPESPESAAPPERGEPAALPFLPGHRPYSLPQASSRGLRTSRKRPGRGRRAEEASTIRWGASTVAAR